ncbi:MAG: DUF1294 domain-containing protein [Bacilli bacterium]|nr:DUF1294 domain-containing protein [Bacilli bacterium]MBR1936067.1 DUF1294 domain-containing protein [Bacilli bacterium]
MKLLYIIIINILSFILMGWDKYSAIKNNWRISEKNLLGLSVLGGAFGTLLGMIVFRHKTRKKSFTYTIPILLIFNIFLYLKILNILTLPLR